MQLRQKIVTLEDRGYLTDKSTLPVSQLGDSAIQGRQTNMHTTHSESCSVIASISCKSDQYKYLTQS